jgi:uncharacterized protein YjiS (DUF1127 family)
MARGHHVIVDNRFRHAAESWAARLGSGFSVVRRCLATLRLWRQRAQERRALAALDDRLLADIGVTRADAERECAAPFWHPAPSEREPTGR